MLGSPEAGREFLIRACAILIHGDAVLAQEAGDGQGGNQAQARALYERFLSLCRGTGVTVEEGQFGAMMEVSLVNHGPVTIVLDSRKS